MSIPLQLVTGFLGSGKTTFLKNYLETFSGKRKIGVIQNEFSEANIDGQELHQTKSEFKLLEINNGSVFCVCLLGSFVESLAAFVDQFQPEELIMEASGMSDPLSVGQIFQSSALRNKVFLDHVWCLVDAHNIAKVAAMQTRVAHQIRIADTVIMNKADLAGTRLDDALLQVKRLNPFAALETTSFARVSFDDRKNVLKFFRPDAEVEIGRPDLKSVVIKSNRLISMQNLLGFIGKVRAGCIRAKGYVNLNSGKKVFFQSTFDDYSLTEAEPFAMPTEFVIIGNFPEGENYQVLFENFCEK
jgi:Putative GTPases (G3E family)